MTPLKFFFVLSIFASLGYGYVDEVNSNSFNTMNTATSQLSETVTKTRSITNSELELRAGKILSQMTLEQKAQLVTGIGMEVPGLMQTIRPEKVSGQAGSTMDFETLGLPGMVMADGPAGLRIEPKREGEAGDFYCTAFPVGTLVASTWDTALSLEMGKAMGQEVKEYGVDVLLAPAINIHRNPLAGRNFEYASEDPLLGGKISAALINGIESNGVGTSLKHFVANNQETNRMLINAHISERTLREIYLRGFEIAIKESQPWTVMSAYNQVNGKYASENKDLLQSILRDEWGFEGIVVTDWFAGTDPVAQMLAGNDLLMPGFPHQPGIIVAAVNEGRLPEQILDRNASRILQRVLESQSYAKYEYSNKPNLDEHAKLARKVAAEGAILLKNENQSLPLSAESGVISVFGVGSYDFVSGGTGSGDVNEAYTISLVEGFDNAGLTIDPELKQTYESFISAEKEKLPEKKFFFELLPPIPEMELGDNTLDQKARNSELAIITIGRNSGEFQDRNVEDDFNLTIQEIELIDKVSKAYKSQNKKTIVILNIGNVIETASWRDKVDAILLAWQGGQEAGNAVADVLLGKVNPSGKLPTSFPIRYSDIASAKNFPGENLPGSEEQFVGAISKGFESEVTYEEGIYVGYRYFQTFDVKTAYPFGFGLSYSTFEFSDIVIKKANENGFVASIKIKNTGKTPGKEVAQLYVSAPSQDMHKPQQELIGFAKTKLLNPGEEELLQIEFNSKDLASFDSERSAWKIEKGEHKLKIGSSSDDIHLEEGLDITEERIVEEVNRVLLPQKKINELTP